MPSEFLHLRYVLVIAPFLYAARLNAADDLASAREQLYTAYSAQLADCW